MRIRLIDTEIPEDSDDLPDDESLLLFDEDDASFCQMALKEVTRMPSEAALLAELEGLFSELTSLPRFPRSRKVRP
jgi:hypothetical protein